MSDLLLPLFVALCMFILIDYLETSMPVLFLGLLFTPVGWIFYHQLANGGYTTLFGAGIASYVSLDFIKIIGIIMFFIPLMAFVKIMYIKKTGVLDVEETT